uniref:ER lumen protein-retaining receptor n=1 Tax=Panagrolaimus davidi TaxID=227884 RepID=A0A914PKF3_9BILA
MNIFRLAADISHLVAIAILLAKIWTTRSCAGISGRSQVLFLIVFVCRYLDLFFSFISVYNTVMKILFVSSSIATVYLIFVKFRATYDKNHDIFWLSVLIVPAFILALLINQEFSFFEACLLHSFIRYNRSVAIMPQLDMLSRTGSAETITAHYLFALGTYRGLYVLHYFYRFYLESHTDPIPLVAGIVQTVLYADFFYLYVTRVIQQNRNIQMPI